MTDLQPSAWVVRLPVTIRPACKEDLLKLEWYGKFSHFRNLFRRSFREQQQGSRLLLVADSGDFPIARLFIQFRSVNEHIADGRERGYLYSFHVMEMFRGRGIGTRMLAEAEAILRRRHYSVATIGVAKDNPDALRLYERLGYRQFSESPGRWRYLDHKGYVREVNEPSWLLEKKLSRD